MAVIQTSQGSLFQPMGYFKAYFHAFPGVGGGPTFSRGGGGGGGGESNCLFPIETLITCEFPEGVGTPCPPPPSGSELGLLSYRDLLEKKMEFYMEQA